MPVRSFVSFCIFASRSFQPSGLSGQPKPWASGSGIATTIGLCAIDLPSVGLKPEASDFRRSSQVDESGTHTSGTVTAAAASPTPVSVTPCLRATAPAMVAGLTPVTLTLTQVPLTLAPSVIHACADCSMAGAISVAAATVSLI
jgi:hypothetical protein